MTCCAICDKAIKEGEPFRRHRRRDLTGSVLATSHTHKACRGRPTIVPFIAQWSGETASDPTVVLSPFSGVAYADETALDRDDRGVLWQRRPDSRGVGRPMYGKVHSGRQRQAMAGLLCHVCGGPADQDDRGVLWLLEDGAREYPQWPEDLMTVHPPICLDCIPLARQQCPHLWAGSVAVRVKASKACAVFGLRYTASRVGPIPVEGDIYPFESPLLPLVVATQLVRALYDCTIVTLTEELAAHA
ncbi:hypothetical protein [Streptomyces lancefieldiae]|uniref:Phage protein n=1 Tax=Streptomyces lancefieldiae TaxID=3075520 RepID=A0ABU3AFT1_9ACTN|nr:hypothetical protein [Streptomyces sp. DSM 40712]MDT0609026.1 hypothetical protein [Streptomyces sp. DSM 40712]